MTQSKGPEDNPSWKNMAHEVKTPIVISCRVCGREINLWHCAESGCCWCAECGANCKYIPKEK